MQRREPRGPPVTLTLLSNGYGEDAVGALLAAEFVRQRPGLEVAAFPTVDRGLAYEGLNLPILGPRRVMPSGGLLMHTWQLFAEDMRSGFLGMTLRQLRDLRRLETDVLVVVGDVYALLVSSLVRTGLRFHVQTLVSVHHTGRGPSRLNRTFMEQIRYPERALMRHLVQRVYVRDEATAALLQAKGVRRVSALGNPMLDGVRGNALARHVGTERLVALLPGTRRYASDALKTMLDALAEVPRVTGLVAWAGGVLPEVQGWAYQPQSGPDGLSATFHRNGQTVYVYEGRFADVLASSPFVIGTSGTANEQAAALGKSVLSFELPPHYSRAFLRNQQRILGDALSIAASEPSALAGVLARWFETPPVARDAPSRMGGAGGTVAIVEDILRRSRL